LETTNLNADYGIILCSGFKVVGEGKPWILSINDYPEYKKDCTNDKRLVKDIAHEVIKADAILTWFGTYFDLPFLNTRLLFHKLPGIPSTIPHIDGWKTARYKLKLRNNRLNTVQDFLQLPTEKDAVKGPIWIKAISGDERALRYIINHCRKDIMVLEEAYERLLPLIANHPHRGVAEDGMCPVCAGRRLQKRGSHITKARIYQRFQCMGCGSWSRSVKANTVNKTGVIAM
jgi:uncharacterized protein YprB with RNaseH-like and TPR domain